MANIFSVRIMRKLFVIALLAVLPSLVLGRPLIGYNIHRNMSNELLAVLVNDNVKVVRLDVFYDDDATEKANVKAWITKLTNLGIRVEASIQTGIQWDNTCTDAPATAYTEAYNQSYARVEDLRDTGVQYWEILNEIQLRPEINTAGQVIWNSQQDSTTNYENSSCMAILEEAARGIEDAVHAVATTYGKTFYVILGEVGRDWGFLTHMANSGVQYDWISFHAYPRNADATITTDTWFGTGGVVGKLAAFGKPVTWNKFNCGETYDGTTIDTEGSTLAINCENSLIKHLTAINAQTTMDLRHLVLYEVVNVDTNGGQEKYFGLYKSNWVAKKRHAFIRSQMGGRMPAAN